MLLGGAAIAIHAGEDGALLLATSNSFVKLLRLVDSIVLFDFLVVNLEESALFRCSSALSSAKREKDEEENAQGTHRALPPSTCCRTDQLE